MKKIIALALTLVLVLSMSVTVFAADPDYLGEFNNPEDPAASANGNTTDAHQVKITLTGAVTSDKVYYVVVGWEELTFTYTFDTSVTWNPLEHAYEDGVGDAVAEPGSWSGAKTITVTNHSNDNVTVTATREAAPNNNGVTITATVANPTLNSAVGTDFGTAPSTTVEVSVSGTPTDLDVAQDTVVGTVVIAISHS